MNNSPDAIWKALADSTRRQILDHLADGPLTTGDLVDRCLPHSRTNIMKHLDVLVAAGLVQVRREGRQRWNQLDPVPIQRVCDRWIRRHVQGLASAFGRLQDHLDDSPAVPREGATAWKRSQGTRPSAVSPNSTGETA